MKLHDHPLNKIRNDCAVAILNLHQKARAGHIGASLSCLEILVDLCFHRASAEDVLILSKGHAASALYVTLAKSGRIQERELEQFYKDGSQLAAHPPCSGYFQAIPFGTGSLGHGLSLAVGLSLSQKFTGKDFKVYCILSEGDCNEGATWEAALFAAHHRLDNLTVIIDANGIQGFGPSCEVLNLEPLDEKWRSFGFQTEISYNGNSFEALESGHQRLSTSSSRKPKCLIARTIKGYGVSYMENRMEWHYLPMNDEQHRTALRETEGKNA